MDWHMLVVILLLLTAIWWLMRKRRAGLSEVQKPAQRVKAKKTAYHAVSINFPSTACAAAKSMAGRRFLATAPPKLPLPDCDARECRCRFAHHDDRRSGKERRNPFAPGQTIVAAGSYKKEQRAGKDRRKADSGLT